jgi:N-acetylglutamate synthase
MMEYKVVEMTLDRYDELMSFWKNIEGIWISSDDDYDNLNRFLNRNPGLNLVVLYEGHIIGTIKCGHDGRRGYLHHLAIAKEYRGHGIGKELVTKCIKNLEKDGIRKIRVFVMDNNQNALNFWNNIGFDQQTYDYRT